MYRRYRRVRRQPRSDEANSDLFDVGRTHHDDDRSSQLGYGAPPSLGYRHRVLVAGEHREGPGRATGGKGDTRHCRTRQSRSDAGNHLEGDSRLVEGLGLLCSPGEDERVAALQPDDAFVTPAALDEDGVYLFLRDGRGTRSFADVDELCPRSYQTKQRAGEAVMDDHICDV